MSDIRKIKLVFNTPEEAQAASTTWKTPLFKFNQELFPPLKKMAEENFDLFDYNAQTPFTITDPENNWRSVQVTEKCVEITLYSQAPENQPFEIHGYSMLVRSKVEDPENNMTRYAVKLGPMALVGPSLITVKNSDEFEQLKPDAYAKFDFILIETENSYEVRYSNDDTKALVNVAVDQIPGLNEELIKLNQLNGECEQSKQIIQTQKNIHFSEISAKGIQLNEELLNSKNPVLFLEYICQNNLISTDAKNEIKEQVDAHKALIKNQSKQSRHVRNSLIAAHNTPDLRGKGLRIKHYAWHIFKLLLKTTWYKFKNLLRDAKISTEIIASYGSPYSYLGLGGLKKGYPLPGQEIDLEQFANSILPPANAPESDPRKVAETFRFLFKSIYPETCWDHVPLFPGDVYPSSWSPDGNTPVDPSRLDSRRRALVDLYYKYINDYIRKHGGKLPDGEEPAFISMAPGSWENLTYRLFVSLPKPVQVLLKVLYFPLKIISLPFRFLYRCVSGSGRSPAQEGSAAGLRAGVEQDKQAQVGDAILSRDYHCFEPTSAPPSAPGSVPVVPRKLHGGNTYDVLNRELGAIDPLEQTPVAATATEEDAAGVGAANDANDAAGERLNDNSHEQQGRLADNSRPQSPLARPGSHQDLLKKLQAEVARREGKEAPIPTPANSDNNSGSQSRDKSPPSTPAADSANSSGASLPDVPAAVTP